MSYKVIFSDLADKQLNKLSSDVQRRIISTLKRCRIRPHTHVKKLVGSEYYRLRVGYYRVIMNIVDNRLVIHVIEMGHRKNIYKKAA
ncbi:type II toxin-antitoxin system RelE/ParE family toxin [Candidatus Peregrinibacteria bacterium]|nr:type II toxin-antitoxin system RelE/ParE family toxin [Candidatus Peregrinibacteria bacterium]